jgi:UDP-glucose 4-epimerase
MAMRWKNDDGRAPFNNKNFYGATKICGEAMLRRSTIATDSTTSAALHERVRSAPGLPGAYIAVIMKMLDAIDNGEGPTIFGDGSEAFDFIAVEDCAKANICAMKADAVDRFYNVGTGQRTSLKEIAERLLALTARTRKSATRRAVRPRWCANRSAARSRLPRKLASTPTSSCLMGSIG